MFNAIVLPTIAAPDDSRNSLLFILADSFCFIGKPIIKFWLLNIALESRSLNNIMTHKNQRYTNQNYVTVDPEATRGLRLKAHGDIYITLMAVSLNNSLASAIPFLSVMTISTEEIGQIKKASAVFILSCGVRAITCLEASTIAFFTSLSS
jgi:hypothetical protein